MKTDQDRIRALLAEAIRVLCKNGLNYKREFSIEGLLGITLDREDVFLVNINETVSPAPVEVQCIPQNESDGSRTPHRGKENPHASSISESQDINISSERAAALDNLKSENHMQLPVRTFDQPETASSSGYLGHSPKRKRTRSDEKHFGYTESRMRHDGSEHSVTSSDLVVVKEEHLSDSEGDSVAHLSQPLFREENSMNSQGEASEQPDLSLSLQVVDGHQHLAGRSMPVTSMWDPTATLGYTLPTMAGMAAMAQSFNSTIGAAVLNQV